MRASVVETIGRIFRRQIPSGTPRWRRAAATAGVRPGTSMHDVPLEPSRTLELVMQCENHQLSPMIRKTAARRLIALYDSDDLMEEVK